MKIKPTSKNGGVVVELGRNETQMPTEAPAPATRPPFKLKKILVPVDFSECSKGALEYALPIARQFGAELIVLHVVQDYPLAVEMVQYIGDAISESRRELEGLRRDLAPDLVATSLVRQGIPHAEIVSVAREQGVDLILLSTHGRSGLAHVLLGSTAERVVRHAPCPVLVVRDTTPSATLEVSAKATVADPGVCKVELDRKPGSKVDRASACAHTCM